MCRKRGWEGSGDWHPVRCEGAEANAAQRWSREGQGSPGEQLGKAFEVPAVGVGIEGGFVGAKVVGRAEAVESVDERGEVSILGENGADLGNRIWRQVRHLAADALERKDCLGEEVGGLPRVGKHQHGSTRELLASGAEGCPSS